MAADGAPFTGFLYAGLMIDKTGAPKVIEFNVRFGDPETQPIMMRLRSDLLEHIEPAIAGHLDTRRAPWDPRPALDVVIAAEGYPGNQNPGHIINTWALQDIHEPQVLHPSPPTTPSPPPATAAARCGTRAPRWAW